jgi:heme/copper-type cytochrome/quinol oxidase subunit 3
MTETTWTSTRRSAGVTCAAALAVLGSGTALLLWGNFLLNVLNAEPDSNGKRLYELHPLAVLFIATVPSFLIFSGMGTGVGLFQLKPWARRAALAWATLALCFGLSIIAFRPFETFFIPEHFVNDLESFKQLLAISLVVATVPIGVWWIFFFRLPSVKRQFEPEADEAKIENRK